MTIHVKSNRKRVLVTGRNYGNILTISRAFGEAGYDVVVLKVYKKKPNPLNLLNKIKCDHYSMYVKEYYECIANDNYEKIVDELIKINNKDEKILLMPVDDYLVYVVDSYLDKLSNHFYIPSINHEQGKINCLLNKNEQKELAIKYHLPVLQSNFIKIENQTYTIPENIIYPCFVKPNVSMKSTKSIMRKCENKEELEDMLSKISGDVELLVEEYADIKQEYSLLGISTKEKTISPGLFKVIKGGNKERKGVTVIGEVIPTDTLKEVIEQCNEFVSRIGYEGIFDIDYIETKNGNVYFVEINFRPGASIHAFTKLGVNMPKMLADYYMHGIQISDNYNLDEYGKTFVSEKVLFEELVRGDVTYKMFNKYMNEVDIHFIKDDKDKEPYKHFKKFIIIALLMKIPYMIRDRIKN